MTSPPRLAVARPALIRELAEHAKSNGQQITLEMYEDTYVGTADGAIRFLEEVGPPRSPRSRCPGHARRRSRSSSRSCCRTRSSTAATGFASSSSSGTATSSSRSRTTVPASATPRQGRGSRSCRRSSATSCAGPSSSRQARARAPRSSFPPRTAAPRRVARYTVEGGRVGTTSRRTRRASSRSRRASARARGVTPSSAARSSEKRRGSSSCARMGTDHLRRRISRLRGAAGARGEAGPPRARRA